MCPFIDYPGPSEGGVGDDGRQHAVESLLAQVTATLNVVLLGSQCGQILVLGESDITHHYTNRQETKRIYAEIRFQIVSYLILWKSLLEFSLAG